MDTLIKSLTYISLLFVAVSPVAAFSNTSNSYYAGGDTGVYLYGGSNGVGAGASVLGIGAGAGIGTDEPEESSSYYYTIPE